MMKNLLTIIGFLIAGFCFFVWYGGRNGAHIESMTPVEQGMITDASPLDAQDFGARSLERPDEVSRSNNRMKIKDAPEKLAVVGTPSASSSSNSLKKQVEHLSEAAVSNALDHQIPAGASLALLIYSAQRGKQLTISNLNQVIEYLLGVKHSAAKEDLQSYFKYASNSEKWFQGLGLDRNGSHPKADLLKIYRDYDLKRYDKNVLAFVASPSTSRLKFDKNIEPESEAPAMSGDASDDEVRRNHAFAKNRWVEKVGKNTDADVKFVPAKRYEKSTISKARQEVERLDIGESMTFDNPGDYHAAVKELVALEAGHESWSDYENAEGKSKAERAFRKRAEKGGFMATGTLKVTREK
ncbi:MAG: hypothetical protein SFU99_04235 [Saprospiraceae bacterium]|nr:hypothetical protein [Saprospiraceae bacterium]